MSNNDFLDTLAAQNAEQKCDVDRVIALARKLGDEKEHLANKLAETVKLGLTACAVTEAAMAQGREWEKRAELAKSIIKILIDLYDISDEEYAAVVTDVLLG